METESFVFLSLFFPYFLPREQNDIDLSLNGKTGFLVIISVVLNHISAG